MCFTSLCRDCNSAHGFSLLEAPHNICEHRQYGISCPSPPSCIGACPRNTENLKAVLYLNCHARTKRAHTCTSMRTTCVAPPLACAHAHAHQCAQIRAPSARTTRTSILTIHLHGARMHTRACLWHTCICCNLIGAGRRLPSTCKKLCRSSVLTTTVAI